MKRGRELRVAILVGFAFLIGQVCGQGERQSTRRDYENAMQIAQRAYDGMVDRVQTIQAKLKATDEQIERRVSRIVDYLSTVADSTSSGTRIIRAKEDVLQGLKNSIDVYARERDTRFAALYRATSRLSKEDLIDDVTRLNDRIEKRVQQVLAITMSLPEEKEVPQVQQTYYGDVVTTQANPEYLQNKMVTARSSQIRKKVKQGLQASVDRLQNSNRELERNLSSARTEAEEQFIRDFIQRNREVIDQRQADIMRVLTDSRPASRELAARAADELVRQVQAERAEARTDANEWIRLKNDWDLERGRLRDCEARLSHYKQVLAEWKDPPAMGDEAK